MSMCPSFTVSFCQNIFDISHSSPSSISLGFFFLFFFPKSEFLLHSFKNFEVNVILNVIVLLILSIFSHFIHKLPQNFFKMSRAQIAFYLADIQLRGPAYTAQVVCCGVCTRVHQEEEKCLPLDHAQ